MFPQAYSAAIDAIYEAAPEPSRWPGALQAVADCTNDLGALLLYGRDDGHFGVINSPSLQAATDAYHLGWNQHDIRALRSRERGYFVERDVITDSDVVSEAELRSAPFYADFLRSHGLQYFAAGMVSPDPRIEVALSIQRKLGREPFSDAELAIIKQLAGHVERSLRLSIHLIDSRLVNEGLASAFSRLNVGIFVLDSLTRILFSNPTANRLAGDGLTIADDRLLIGGRSASVIVDREVTSLMTHPSQDWSASPKPILIERKDNSRPLALYILPIAAGGPMDRILAHARAIVLVIDSQPGEPPEPALVRDLLGLTLGEARIASLVGSGVTPRDAAGRLGIAEETVRSVLKRVFSKTGVARQSELAALMTRLVLR